MRQLPFLLKACAQWAGISTKHLTQHDSDSRTSLLGRVDNTTTDTTNITTPTNTAASLVVALAFEDIVKSIYGTSITTIDILHLWWDILNKYALSSSHIEGKEGGQNYDLSLSEHFNEVYNCVSCDWLDPTVVHGATYPLKSTVPILPVEEEDDKMDIAQNYDDQGGIKSEILTDIAKPLTIKLKHTTTTSNNEGHNSDTPPLPQLPVVSTDVLTTTAPSRKFKSLKLSLKTSDNIVTTTTALRYTATSTSDTSPTDPTAALDTNDNGKRYTTRGHRLSAEFLRRAVDADIHDIHDTQEQLISNNNAIGGDSSSSAMLQCETHPSPEVEVNGASSIFSTESYNSGSTNNSIHTSPSKKNRTDKQVISYTETYNDDEEGDAYEQDTIFDDDEVENEVEEEYDEEDAAVRGKRRASNKKGSSSNSNKKSKGQHTASSATVTTTKRTTTKRGHNSGGSIRQNIMKILSKKRK